MKKIERVFFFYILQMIFLFSANAGESGEGQLPQLEPGKELSSLEVSSKKPILISVSIDKFGYYSFKASTSGPLTCELFSRVGKKLGRLDTFLLPGKYFLICKTYLSRPFYANVALIRFRQFRKVPFRYMGQRFFSILPPKTYILVKFRVYERIAFPIRTGWPTSYVILHPKAGVVHSSFSSSRDNYVFLEPGLYYLYVYNIYRRNIPVNIQIGYKIQKLGSPVFLTLEQPEFLLKVPEDAGSGSEKVPVALNLNSTLSGNLLWFRIREFHPYSGRKSYATRCYWVDSRNCFVRTSLKPGGLYKVEVFSRDTLPKFANKKRYRAVFLGVNLYEQSQEAPLETLVKSVEPMGKFQFRVLKGGPYFVHVRNVASCFLQRRKKGRWVTIRRESPPFKKTFVVAKRPPDPKEKYTYTYYEVIKTLSSPVLRERWFFVPKRAKFEASLRGHTCQLVRWNSSSNIPFPPSAIPTCEIKETLAPGWYKFRYRATTKAFNRSIFLKLSLKAHYPLVGLKTAGSCFFPMHLKPGIYRLLWPSTSKYPFVKLSLTSLTIEKFTSIYISPFPQYEWGDLGGKLPPPLKIPVVLTSAPVRIRFSGRVKCQAVVLGKVLNNCSFKLKKLSAKTPGVKPAVPVEFQLTPSFESDFLSASINIFPRVQLSRFRRFYRFSLPYKIVRNQKYGKEQGPQKFSEIVELKPRGKFYLIFTPKTAGLFRVSVQSSLPLSCQLSRGDGLERNFFENSPLKKVCNIVQYLGSSPYVLTLENLQEGRGTALITVSQIIPKDTGRLSLNYPHFKFLPPFTAHSWSVDRGTYLLSMVTVDRTKVDWRYRPLLNWLLLNEKGQIFYYSFRDGAIIPNLPHYIGVKSKLKLLVWSSENPLRYRAHLQKLERFSNRSSIEVLAPFSPFPFSIATPTNLLLPELPGGFPDKFKLLRTRKSPPLELFPGRTYTLTYSETRWKEKFEIKVTSDVVISLKISRKYSRSLLSPVIKVFDERGSLSTTATQKKGGVELFLKKGKYSVEVFLRSSDGTPLPFAGTYNVDMKLKKLVLTGDFRWAFEGELDSELHVKRGTFAAVETDSRGDTFCQIEHSEGVLAQNDNISRENWNCGLRVFLPKGRYRLKVLGAKGPSILKVRVLPKGSKLVRVARIEELKAPKKLQLSVKGESSLKIELPKLQRRRLAIAVRVEGRGLHCLLNKEAEKTQLSGRGDGGCSAVFASTSEAAGLEVFNPSSGGVPAKIGISLFYLETFPLGKELKLSVSPGEPKFFWLGNGGQTALYLKLRAGGGADKLSCRIIDPQTMDSRPCGGAIYADSELILALENRGNSTQNIGVFVGTEPVASVGVHRYEVESWLRVPLSLEKGVFGVSLRAEGPVFCTLEGEKGRTLDDQFSPDGTCHFSILVPEERELLLRAVFPKSEQKREVKLSIHKLGELSKARSIRSQMVSNGGGFYLLEGTAPSGISKKKSEVDSAALLRVSLVGETPQASGEIYLFKSNIGLSFGESFAGVKFCETTGKVSNSCQLYLSGDSKYYLFVHWPAGSGTFSVSVDRSDLIGDKSGSTGTVGRYKVRLAEGMRWIPDARRFSRRGTLLVELSEGGEFVEVWGGQFRCFLLRAEERRLSLFPCSRGAGSIVEVKIPSAGKEPSGGKWSQYKLVLIYDKLPALIAYYRAGNRISALWGEGYSSNLALFSRRLAFGKKYSFSNAVTPYLYDLGSGERGALYKFWGRGVQCLWVGPEREEKFYFPCRELYLMGGAKAAQLLVGNVAERGEFATQKLPVATIKEGKNGPFVSSENSESWYRFAVNSKRRVAVLAVGERAELKCRLWKLERGALESVGRGCYWRGELPPGTYYFQVSHADFSVKSTAFRVFLWGLKPNRRAIFSAYTRYLEELLERFSR